MDEKHTHVF